MQKWMQTSGPIWADFSFTHYNFAQVLAIALASLAALLLLIGVWTNATKRAAPKTTSRNWLSRFVLPIYWAIVATLAITSFGAILLEGHMHGYPLLLHLGAAGAFVFILVLVAPLTMFYGSSDTEASSSNRWWLVRWSAGLMVVSGIVTAASMFLSMLPILGTPGLLEAAAIHRYAGLAVVLFCILHITAIACTRLGLR